MLAAESEVSSVIVRSCCWFDTLAPHCVVKKILFPQCQLSEKRKAHTQISCQLVDGLHYDGWVSCQHMISFQKSSSSSDPSLPWSVWAACAPRDKAVKARVLVWALRPSSTGWRSRWWWPPVGSTPPPSSSSTAWGTLGTGGPALWPTSGESFLNTY